MAKAKPEVFRGDLVVTVTTLAGRGWLVSWRSPVPQAILLPHQTTARALAEALAAGAPPLPSLARAINYKKRAKITAKAGVASWAGLTPEQRSERARANARKRWEKAGPAPAVQAEEGKAAQ